MKKGYVIAIDGPAASGKSTTAKLLAEKLKYVYIDSGAMYRACALAALNHKIDLSKQDEIRNLMDNIRVQIKYHRKGNKILLNGEDVTKRIRKADITKLSSEIAVIEVVREKMVDLQREIGKDGAVIMDGRDIGTVVFPDADFKFFMVADVKTRALRRWKEAKKKGEDISLEDIEKELIWRDKNDTNRKISPLTKAKNAIEIDTSDMSIPEQVDFLYKIINQGK